MGGMAGANTLCPDSLLLLILCLTYHVYYDHDQHFEYEIEKAPVIDCDRKKVLWSYIQE